MPKSHRKHLRFAQIPPDEAARLEKTMERLAGQSRTAKAESPQQSPPGLPTPPYNIFRRLVVPNVTAQLERQVEAGRILLRHPNTRLARFRKPGEIMVPILGRLQLNTIMERGTTPAELKTLLEKIRASLKSQVEEKIEGRVTRVGVRKSHNDPIPRLLIDGYSPQLRRDRMLADATLQKRTGAMVPYNSKKEFIVLLGDSANEYPGRVKGHLEYGANQLWAAGSRLIFGRMEVVDLQKDAERYLGVYDIVKLA